MLPTALVQSKASQISACAEDLAVTRLFSIQFIALAHEIAVGNWSADNWHERALTISTTGYWRTELPMVETNFKLTSAAWITIETFFV
jgi:hypothetical protein